MRILLFSSLIVAWLGLTVSIFGQGSCSKATFRNPRSEQSISNQPPAPASSDLREWRSPEVAGLKLGKSKVEDVKRLFGEPAWEGSNQEKVFTEDPEDEILVQYRNVTGINSQYGEVNLDLIIGEETKVVKWLTIYTEVQLTRKDIITQYGNDYFEIESWESSCIEKDRAPGPSGNKMKYPIALVYPNRGMYVSIGEDNYVVHIGYGMGCGDK